MNDEAKVAIVLLVGFFILMIAMVLSETPQEACIKKGNIYIDKNNINMCIPPEQYYQYIKDQNGSASNSQEYRRN